MHPGARKGFSLLEVMIVVAVLAVALGTVLGGMVSTQEAVANSIASQEANAMARRTADSIVEALRDANLVATDMDPDTWSATTVKATTPAGIGFRAIKGWDEANSRPLLSPTRASNGFQRLRFVGTDVILSNTVTGEARTIASLVKDLKVTYDGTDTLTIEVTVERRDTRRSGEVFQATVTVQLFVRNKIALCT